MPVKPLPKFLIQRLRRIVNKRIRTHGESSIDYFLAKMTSVDHRRKWLEQQFGKGLEHNRVREMNVSRNFPETKLIIKKLHYPDELKILRNKVRNHNKRKGLLKFDYILRMPFAYSLGHGFVAMTKTNKPNLAEILESFKDGGTYRGKNFFRELVKDSKITRSQLVNAARKASELTKLNYGNIL
ncbi:hypothetical protein KKB11_03670, partial [Candidatus Micrarchaeota archaeon]|nr:hypothetical protein [Candidatus Micrarchaeota archaeon]